MDIRLLRIAVIYLIVGVLLGLYISVSNDFAPVGAHAHIYLLGWATLALTAIAYRLYPAMRGSPLAKTHFWLHNLGLPLAVVGLMGVMYGYPELGGPVAGSGSLLIFSGLAAFSINLFRNANGRVEALSD